MNEDKKHAGKRLSLAPLSYEEALEGLLHAGRHPKEPKKPKEPVPPKKRRSGMKKPARED